MAAMRKVMKNRRDTRNFCFLLSCYFSTVRQTAFIICGTEGKIRGPFIWKLRVSRWQQQSIKLNPRPFREHSLCAARCAHSGGCLLFPSATLTLLHLFTLSHTELLYRPPSLSSLPQLAQGSLEETTFPLTLLLSSDWKIKWIYGGFNTIKGNAHSLAQYLPMIFELF